ncbi:hypothetical protein F5144DRAFT_560873 [Chaetomium tenue]|uniref:Uncharacterized protein n=1 Tax=Chaetomium tenue TaxID=1854479 RepID=A0ACB7PHQ2_9PEZI|nr:hypothetical protein F5144DRAFT_560873 [Chaetomium globosum]
MAFLIVALHPHSRIFFYNVMESHPGPKLRLTSFRSRQIILFSASDVASPQNYHYQYNPGVRCDPDAAPLQLQTRVNYPWAGEDPISFGCDDGLHVKKHIWVPNLSRPRRSHIAQPTTHSFTGHLTREVYPRRWGSAYRERLARTRAVRVMPWGKRFKAGTSQVPSLELDLCPPRSSCLSPTIQKPAVWTDIRVQLTVQVSRDLQKPTQNYRRPSDPPKIRATAKKGGRMRRGTAPAQTRGNGGSKSNMWRGC